MVEHPQAALLPPSAAPARKSGQPAETPGKPSRLDAALDGPSGLAFVLAIAALLTCLNVMGALRSDEVWSLNTASKPFADMMAELRGDIHPPLYYWFLFPWIRVFGTSEFALRGLSGFFYLGSVFSLHRWGQQLAGGRAGTIVACVYLTSPLAILASHTARMYSLLSLVSILSTWLYWAVFVKDRRSNRNLALLSIVNALGTLTHIWFFFLLFAEGVHWLAMQRRYKVEFAGSMALSIAPYAAFWLPTLLRQLGKSEEAAAWLFPPTFADIGAVSFVYAGVVFLLLPASIWLAVKKHVPPFRWANGFALMLVTALAVPFALSYIKPVFYSRFTIVGLHLFAFVVAACVTRVSNWQLPALVSAIALTSSIYAAVAPTTCDARWGAEYLARQAASGDSVVFTSLSRPPVDHYLHQISGPARFSESSFPAEIDAHPGYEGSLFAPGRDVLLKKEAEEFATQLRQRTGRVYFFHGFHPEIDAFLESALDRRFKRTADKSYQCAGMPCYYNAITVYE